MKWKIIFVISLFVVLLVGGFYMYKQRTIQQDVIGNEQQLISRYSGENWWNSSFANRIQITFNTGGITENLTNFPVMVMLNSTRINYSLTQNSGQDIRFIDSDNTTRLPHEIELWNESNRSFVWIQVPSINVNTTDYIWMYYNNATTGDLQNETGTWDTNYQGIFHLGDGDSTATNFYQDSTSNNRNGTLADSDGDSAQSIGKIGNAMDFAGDADYISWNHSFNNPASQTFSAWVNFDGINAGLALDRGELWNQGDSFVVFLDSTGCCGTGTQGFVDDDSNDELVPSGSAGTLAGTGWRYISFVANNAGNQVIFYLDGVVAGSPVTWNDNIIWGTGTRLGEHVGGNIAAFDGDIDEARVSNSARSSSWIKAEYNTSKDTFNTYGTVESIPPKWSSNYTNSTLNGTAINHSVNWTDNVALSGFIFSFNNGNGSFLNDTFVSMTGTANQSNSTKVVNSTAGSTIQWKVYANGSSNTFNVTDTFQYTTTTEWWNNSFSNRIRITFNNSNSSENLVNFPALVVLNSTRIDYSLTQNLGQDIRFIDADNTTSLPYEIELWNETNQSFVWVKVPQIDANVSTDYIWMYYNNATTGDLQNRTGVWDSNFKGVWHLKNGSTLNASDSTSNNNGGTITGTLASLGKIDGGADFDGTDDKIDLGTPAFNISTGLSISAWLYFEGGGGIHRRIINHGVIGASPWNEYVLTTYPTGEIGFELQTGGVETVLASPTDLPTNQWVYVTATWNGTTMYLYENASQKTSTAKSGTITEQNNITSMGHLDYLGTGYYFFNGLIDEMRVSNSARSRSWIEAEYKNGLDTYNIFGSAETPAASNCWINTSEYLYVPNNCTYYIPNGQTGYFP